jgi:AcrR family transcriptional regulator
VSAGSYARRVLDAKQPPGGTRAERRDQATADTRGAIVSAARSCLLADGYANLSTRRVADAAQVPLSQIHYHFGSKRQLILAVLEAENERLLERQREMFDAPKPLWVRWDLACDFLDTDLESGYVRILQEMIAAGWSDPEVAAAVRGMIGAWPTLLAEVARREQERGADLGEFTADEIGALMAMPFLGAEELILLGVAESTLPMRSALRKIGLLLRRVAAVPEAEPANENDSIPTAR